MYFKLPLELHLKNTTSINGGTASGRFKSTSVVVNVCIQLTVFCERKCEEQIIIYYFVQTAERKCVCTFRLGIFVIATRVLKTILLKPSFFTSKSIG